MKSIRSHWLTAVKRRFENECECKCHHNIVQSFVYGGGRVSEERSLELGMPVIEFLSDSMLKKIKKASVARAIGDNRLLLLSVVRPDMGFNVGVVMMRNRYIYAQSSSTVVVRAEYNKGGTWNGATENLKYHWCKEFYWNNQAYRGNRALIEKGAIPIDRDWDGDADNARIPMR